MNELIEKEEALALMKLMKASAANHQKEASDFREHSLSAAIKGGHDFKIDHPVYLMLIEPLVEEIERICKEHGLSYLFTAHTPIEGLPLYSKAQASFMNNVPPTFLNIISILKAQPTIDSEGKSSDDDTPE